MVSATPAAFSAADINFIQGLQETLRQDIGKGRDYGGVLATVIRRLDCFQKAIESTATLEESQPWGSLVCTVTRDEPDGPDRIQITGCNLDEDFETVARSSQDASGIVHYVSALGAACTRLEEIRQRLLAIVRKSEELEHEQMGLRQPAETTVDGHIRLLRQYNKTKDAGQQLIGMIADSRQVSLGDIYRDGQYGVSADD
ncbi:unnamed protein product [Discula destructiva]